MAERVVDDLQRILRVAIGFGLAESHLGQIALDLIDQHGVHAGRGRHDARAGEGRDRLRLPLQMTQDIVQSFLDLAEIIGPVIVIHFEAFEQIRHALFEMRERGRGIIADRQMVEPVRQGAQCTFEVFGIVGNSRLRTLFERRRQSGDALFERREALVERVGTAELIDLGGKHTHIVAEPTERFIRGDIGYDGAQGSDRTFELFDGAGIAAAAHDQIDLAAEIADRVIKTGELFGRRQGSQHLIDVGERALDAGQCLAVGAALA